MSGGIDADSGVRNFLICLSVFLSRACIFLGLFRYVLRSPTSYP